MVTSSLGPDKRSLKLGLMFAKPSITTVSILHEANGSVKKLLRLFRLLRLGQVEKHSFWRFIASLESRVAVIHFPLAEHVCLTGCRFGGEHGDGLNEA